MFVVSNLRSSASLYLFHPLYCFTPGKYVLDAISKLNLARARSVRQLNMIVGQKEGNSTQCWILETKRTSSLDDSLR